MLYTMLDPQLLLWFAVTELNWQLQLDHRMNNGCLDFVSSIPRSSTRGSLEILLRGHRTTFTNSS